jgi:NAD(P)H-dependent flavin oxidoreductase YrpB (nitropropane dioxygenase family)
MDRQTLALMIPIIAMLIPISAIVMAGMHRMARLRLEEARARAGVLPDGTLAELDQMHGELDQVRRELAEVQERLDFAERLLAQRHEPDRLPGKGG